ncbi:GerW family sporulation protein [Oceanobacillus bengalensis]|uniref:Sporulation protein YtfJ n=1 Tax=Oceanobacillus bengalensis TaxID=1435466 RepID=A0A494YX86_9BACI|nr:GerW family sporulation protein [Oceanobacillus bengalensis]RKQ14635.1 sporulation protein YtfJ [Oceanobacillus bengalensis]
MSEHPIQGLMTTAMENLKDMIDANTIIGDPVESPDGSIIIPVSKLGFGFAAGGSEFGQGDSEGELPFGGGSGGGVSITPIAFLIIGKNGIKMVHLDQHTHLYEKLLNNTPQLMEKIQAMLKESGIGKNKEDKKNDKGKKEDSGNGNEEKKEERESSSYDI